MNFKVLGVLEKIIDFLGGIPPLEKKEKLANIKRLFSKWWAPTNYNPHACRDQKALSTIIIISGERVYNLFL